MRIMWFTVRFLLLAAKLIAGNEADGQAMPAMVADLRDKLGFTPTEAVADSAYGYGPQRQAMADARVPLSAPVVAPVSRNGLFGPERFTYDPDTRTATCPNNQISVRTARNEKEYGTQLYFDKAVCAQCPLREACTTSKTGRSVFISDYYELMQQAKAYNDTAEGKAAQQTRYRIERTNNELKNHHGLGRARTRGRHDCEFIYVPCGQQQPYNTDAANKVRFKRRFCFIIRISDFMMGIGI